MRWSILFLVARILVAAAPLAERIDAILTSSDASRRAFWGIAIVHAGSGAVVYEKNADHLFVPASNVKLFTSGVALARLGPEHHFETVILAAQQPDAQGTIHGDVVIRGGGDPALCNHQIPFYKGAVAEDTPCVFEQLADQVFLKGVRYIDGDVVGDDTAFVWEPYPADWQLADLLFAYAAPVSALSVYKNQISITVQPAEIKGMPAKLRLSPPYEYYVIDNRVSTVASGTASLHVARTPGSSVVRLWGKIPPTDRGYKYSLSVTDPALFAAGIFTEALVRHGVRISGKPTARHRFPADLQKGFANPGNPSSSSWIQLARHLSPPLVECLRAIDKLSLNLEAEMVLRNVGLVRRGVGNLEAGLEEMKAFLSEASLDENEYSLHDGSGLSPANLITPAAVTKFLVHVYNSEFRQWWLSLLPVGGQEGTLSNRFRQPELAGRILAKTGSLARASALSGYLVKRNNETLAFCIMTNNYSASVTEIRNLIDKICVSALE